LFNSAAAINVILLHSEYTILQGWLFQHKPIKQVATAPQPFSKTAVSYIKGESDCHHKQILTFSCLMTYIYVVPHR